MSPAIAWLLSKSKTAKLARNVTAAEVKSKLSEFEALGEFRNYCQAALQMAYLVKKRVPL